MNGLTLGCDPEIFVGDINGPKSIVGKIGGTKHMPLPMGIGDGFMVQEDNVAIEFNTPPADSAGMFVENVTKATEFLEQLIQDMHGLQFYKDSALSFPKEELDTPAAQTFGCDPDYNAYTGRRNDRPNAEDKNLRSCGGHVHIGIVGTKYAHLNRRDIVKALDLYLGIPSLVMDKTGALRRNLYGRAGAYRMKAYGLEYRSLSNFWIFNRKYMEWVYVNTERALDAVLNGVAFAEDEKLIRNIIDHSIVPAVGFLVEKYKLQVV